MPMSRYKPITVGEVLVEEFMQPVGLTQGALTEAMGVQRSCDPLEALNSPRERFERATPFDTAA